MKFLLVLCAFVGLSLAGLQQDLHDIASVIDRAQMKEIAGRYKECTEVQKAIGYLHSSQWKDLVQTVKSKPQVQQLAGHLLEAGCDLSKVIGFIQGLIEDAASSGAHNDKCTMKQFMTELRNAFPRVKFHAAIMDKYQTSPDFKQFFDVVSSKATQQMVEEVKALPEVQRIKEALIGMNIDIEVIIAFIDNILGW